MVFKRAAIATSIPRTTSSCLDMPAWMPRQATSLVPLTVTQKRYRIAVNIQNLTNRLYYVSGNTPLDIFPGSPINAMMEFQVRY